MAAGLAGVAVLMSAQPVVVLPALIALVGLGIGACWGFGVQRLMGGAKPGEGDLAASAVATVQQTGFALGAAAAGIVATLSGLSHGLSTPGDRQRLLLGARELRRRCSRSDCCRCSPLDALRPFR